MKIETRRTVRNLFASIIKNDAAIDGAKTAPWWIALILFFVGSFLPIIPIMVNASKHMELPLYLEPFMDTTKHLHHVVLN